MKRSFVILLHTGYWILYLLLLTLFMLMLSAGAIKTSTPKQEMIIGFFTIMSIISIIPGLISFYGFYFYIFPRFLETKKITGAVLVGLAITFCCGIIGLVGLNMLNKGFIFSYNSWNDLALMVVFMSLLCMVHGIIALVIKGFINWYGDIRIKQELKQKNVETELALIKSQLDPHFLFNTINNIDVLIEKDAAKASLYLNKMSDIMRFMLYETRTELIPLEKELTYITKYIDLQTIRYANNDFIRFHISGNPGSLRIAPMLFMPFIENAFKHAANKRSENGIVINIDIKDKLVNFYCSNAVAVNPMNTGKAGGLGNELITKRLDLLYPGKHQLSIAEEAGYYIVQLSVEAI